MSQFHELNVAELRKETYDAVSVAFVVPEQYREAYRFQPGQYVTLATSIDGIKVQRPYSICSLPNDPLLRVAIRQHDDGQFSTFANQQLTAGMALDVSLPEGRFVVSADMADEAPMVAIAAGSGITPILAIIGQRLMASTGHVRLIYGNRQTSSILFLETIYALKNQYPERFTVYSLLSRQALAIPLLSQRIGPDFLSQLITSKQLGAPSANHYFVCGPQALTTEITDYLTQLGVANDRIKSELFAVDNPVTSRVSTRRQPRAAPSAATVCDVTVIVDGRSSVFAMGDDDNIISAAENVGLTLPFACKGGMCCTCRCQVKAGEATMAVNYSLEPWELAAGYVLACQTRPKTAALTLDFDAV